MAEISFALEILNLFQKDFLKQEEEVLQNLKIHVHSKTVSNREKKVSKPESISLTNKTDVSKMM